MKKELVVNLKFPHTIKITRSGESSTDPFDSTTGVTETVLYEGQGRRFLTSSDDSVVSSRKASIPLKYDELAESFLKGDKIVATFGNIEEGGLVVDAEPSNGNTTIYWNFVRN